MTTSAEEVRDALIAQWRAVASAIPSRDLETASRVAGWRNREVIAHLTMQPVLLVRFLSTASDDAPKLDAAQNLAGTHNLSELVDAAAREAALADKVDFATRAEEAIAVLAAADLGTTVTTIQGPIGLRDYLVTRCVEAVVHGGDLVAPVEPDARALRFAADALIALLETRAPNLVREASAMPPGAWLDIATGRVAAPSPFAAVTPLME